MWTSFCDLALEQPRDRDPGPLRDDLGDVVGVDLLLEEARPAPCASARPRPLCELLLELGDRPVAELGGALQVGGALGALELDPRPARAAS